MRFGNDTCSWQIIKREVLGEFAVETGVIQKLLRDNDKLRMLASKRRTAIVLGANARSILGKGIAAGHLGKAIKSVELAQQLEFDETLKNELRHLRPKQSDKKKHKLRKGLLYVMHEGSKVTFHIISRR